MLSSCTVLSYLTSCIVIKAHICTVLSHLTSCTVLLFAHTLCWVKILWSHSPKPFLLCHLLKSWQNWLVTMKIAFIEGKSVLFLVSRLYHKHPQTVFKPNRSILSHEQSILSHEQSNSNTIPTEGLMSHLYSVTREVHISPCISLLEYKGGELFKLRRRINSSCL